MKPNTRIGNHVILANNVLLGGYAEIHDLAFIGGGSVVHQYTRMGASSLLQGLSGIGKHGVSTINVVGLRRAGFGPALRKEVKDAFALLYRSGLNSTQALEEAKRRSWSKEVPGQKNLDPGSVAHVTNRRR